jgi:hypothetical protein
MSKYKTSDSDHHRKGATKRSKADAAADLARRRSASSEILRKSSERYSEAMKRLAKR